LEHGLRTIRLPVISAFELDDGLIDSELLINERIYRQLLTTWLEGTKALLAPSEAGKANHYSVHGAILISAALLGGLANPKLWEPLLVALKSPIPTNSLRLIYDLGAGFSWIADPFTESLLRRFYGEEKPRLPSTSTVDVLTVIQPFLASIGQPDQLLSLLAAGAKAYVVTHLAPDVAGVALGNISSAPLPRPAQERVILGMRCRPVESFTMSVRPSTRQRTPVTYLGSHTAEIISDLQAAVKWDLDQRRNRGLPGKTKNVF
jgi:hypothetical protein